MGYGGVRTLTQGERRHKSIDALQANCDYETMLAWGMVRC